MSAFRARLRVRFGETDQAGIVYFPHYLHYCHVALEDFFREELKMSYQDVVNQHRIGFPSRHLDSDYMRPLKFGDLVDIEVCVEHLGTTSIRWRYTLYRNGEQQPATVCRITTVVASMDTLEKCEIPRWLRSPLEDYQHRCAAPRA